MCVTKKIYVAHIIRMSPKISVVEKTRVGVSCVDFDGAKSINIGDQIISFIYELFITLNTFSILQHELYTLLNCH